MMSEYQIRSRAISVLVLDGCVAAATTASTSRVMVDGEVDNEDDDNEDDDKDSSQT